MKRIYDKKIIYVTGYELAVQNLKIDGVYQEFETRWEKLSGMFTPQAAFDILYSAYKLNGKRMFD